MKYRYIVAYVRSGDGRVAGIALFDSAPQAIAAASLLYRALSQLLAPGEDENSPRIFEQIRRKATESVASYPANRSFVIRIRKEPRP